MENAIKYNKAHGWVKVLLDADHQFFTVEVSYSGIGIPEEDYEHIDERFYRVDKSHSREIGGTGLGLAITRNAILLHRGSIKVSSVEGQGTTFTVKMCIRDSQDTDPKAGQQHREKGIPAAAAGTGKDFDTDVSDVGGRNYTHHADADVDDIGIACK